MISSRGPSIINSSCPSPLPQRPLSPLHNLFPLKISKTHMTTLSRTFASALAFLALTSIGFAAETFPLASLELRMDQEYGQPHADASVDNHPLSIGGQKFEHGLGTQATSLIRIALGGHDVRFTPSVGGGGQS